MSRTRLLTSFEVGYTANFGTESWSMIPSQLMSKIVTGSFENQTLAE